MSQVARASLGVALAVSLFASRARADETDACIAAAEQSQIDRRDAHLRAARDKLVFCARDACPNAIQKDCKRWLSDVEGRVPSVVIHAVDAHGDDLTAVHVLVDGARFIDSLDGKAVAVDPGQHDFRFETGQKSIVQGILIREGERDRLLTVKFPAEGSTESAKIPIGAWVLGGVGIASLATGVALWIRGRVERSDLYDTCGVTHDCAQSAVDHARFEIVGGDVASGVGIVALGTAIVWAALGASATSPSVDAHPVVGGGVVTFRGSF